MKLKNIETMQRAIGIIEGASYGASSSVQDALITAVEMLDTVVNDEDVE
jgi:hypothetical protein